MDKQPVFAVLFTAARRPRTVTFHSGGPPYREEHLTVLEGHDCSAALHDLKYSSNRINNPSEGQYSGQDNTCPSLFF